MCKCRGCLSEQKGNASSSWEGSVWQLKLWPGGGYVFHGNFQRDMCIHAKNSAAGRGWAIVDARTRCSFSSPLSNLIDREINGEDVRSLNFLQSLKNSRLYLVRISAQIYSR